MFATIIFNVAQADTESILVRGLSVSWLRSLGHHSYAMYVCHMAVIADIVLVWFPPEQWPTLNGSVLPAQLWVYLLSLGVTLGFAKLSWYAIEKRFLALKRHFPSVTTTKLSR